MIGRNGAVKKDGILASDFIRLQADRDVANLLVV